MLRFILNRIVVSLITVYIIVTVTFVLMHAIPGGPFTKEKVLPPEVLKNIEARYHLDDPLWKQYADYLKNLSRGDLGPSYKYPAKSVSDIIREGFPVSAQLGLISLGIMLVVGIPAGVAAALRQNKWQDHLAMFLSALGITVPNFVLAVLLIYFLGVKLGWLPVSRWISWKSMIMPSLALASYSTAYIARLTRSSVLEVIRQDYIRTARSKGLPERVIIYRHALKNALLPVVTYLGPLAASVLTGSFVVEKIFAIPGLGQHFVLGISNRDYTLILGTTVFYASFLILMNLIVDIVYCLLDPRIKLIK